MGRKYSSRPDGTLLGRKADDITLLDVFRATEGEPRLARGRTNTRAHPVQHQRDGLGRCAWLLYDDGSSNNVFEHNW